MKRPKRSTPLARGHRLRPVSRKTRQAKPEFGAVYDAADTRAGGRCEVVDYPVRSGFRCPSAASEHHHLFKPRRSHHTVREILHVCRTHHEQFERAYALGRRVPTTFNEVAGRYDTAVVYAPSKFVARGTEPAV